MKQNTSFNVKMPDDLLRKMCVVAEAEGRSVNNHILFMVRQNIAYYERVHGKITPAQTDAAKLPEDAAASKSEE